MSVCVCVYLLVKPSPFHSSLSLQISSSKRQLNHSHPAAHSPEIHPKLYRLSVRLEYRSPAHLPVIILQLFKN